MNTVDETVYNLLNHIPQCLPSIPNHTKQTYRSMFTFDVVHNYNKNKRSHRTMGLAVIPKSDPNHPLRRRENYIPLPEITPFIRSHRMPPIPKMIKSNTFDSRISSKNYVKENINQMKNSLPKYPRRYMVSDRKGNKFLMNGSGLQKEFIYKKNYDLKIRHEEVFAEYQRLPLRLETASTLMKHRLFTNELIQIERDIDFLEKHEHIFIDRTL
ncbi:hypothetical protein I4U23_021224 [Adineta vaga]|nr:hypothetical protein I4U23_021224 [Adineta vaga]